MHGRNEYFFKMLNNFANSQGFHLILEACSQENQTLKVALYLTEIFCSPREVLVLKAPFCQELVRGFYDALMGRLESCSLADFARLSQPMILRLLNALEALLSMMMGDDGSKGI